MTSRPSTKRSAERPVPSATNLPSSAEEDQNRRMRQYLVSMGIRTVCFVLGVVLWSPVRWASVVCFVLSGVLPYVAVVFANATGKRKIDVVGSVEPGPLPQKEIHGSAGDDRTGRF